MESNRLTLIYNYEVEKLKEYFRVKHNFEDIQSNGCTYFFSEMIWAFSMKEPNKN